MPMWALANAVQVQRLHMQVTSSDHVSVTQSEQQTRANWQQAHTVRDTPVHEVLR